MADIKLRFEKELKFKISQKAKASQTEESLLNKSFRYFDLNNSGAVTRNEFLKAIQKIGVLSFDDHEVNRLFDYYDTNRDGELDYREFSAIVCGNTLIDQPLKHSPERPSTSHSRFEDNQVDEIFQTIKKRLFDKGATGLISLAKAFRLGDRYQDKKIEFNDFYGILEDNHIGISLKQAEKVFNSWNKSGSGLINYEDFLATFKGRLSSHKKSVITQAFHRLDTDRDGQVDLAELKRSFDGSRHPEVIRGSRNEAEVTREFLNALESYISYKKMRGSSITAEEFEDLYAFIGASFEDEQRFLTMMTNCWKLNQTPDYLENKPLTQRPNQKSFEESKYDKYSSLEDVEQNLNYIIQRFRQRLALKGMKGYVGLYRFFRNADHDDDGIISTKEFIKILRDYKMEIPEQDSLYIFAEFDKGRRGLINFEDFMERVLGNLSLERREIVDTAWRKLDSTQNGKVQISSIQALFRDLRSHPDVKSGRKSQEQVARDFIEVLDFHLNEIVRSQNQFINRREFEEFLLYLSVTTTDDKYFEAVVHTVFKLETERNYQDIYAGAGRRDYDPRGGYLKDFHRFAVTGGSVTSNAPFGTDLQQQSGGFKPTSDYDDTRSSRKGSQYHSQFQFSPTKIYSETYSNRDDISERASQYDRFDRESRISVDGEGFDEIKRKILGRGIRGLLGMIKSLRILDHDRLKNMPVNAFIKALNDYRLDIDEDRIKSTLESYKLIHNGRVEYESFLKLIKGEMSKLRRNLVVAAYERVNAERKGYVTVDDIKEIYDPRHHPDVRSQRRDQDDLALEHVETIDLHHMLFTTSLKGKDKRVSLEEFVDYYEHVSALMENDKQFEQMMTNCWRTHQVSRDPWKEENTTTTSRPQSQRGGNFGGGRY